ncbi:MAG: hypothetical protein JXR58_10590 [Bacteroidales bacterium]|nr:hypothetical protein [Bacteroidales bacterium]
MKFLLLLISIGFFLVDSSCQKQGNIWYFGNMAGVNFNDNPPTALFDGQTYLTSFSPHNEGCSTISDSAGNLLFYSNGEVLFDRNHDVMPNGQLLGHISSTQAALIVPRPLSSRYYYVFTTDAFFENELQFGFRFSIVDLCLNNGLGDVISDYKNVKLLDTVSEKIACVRHSNGVDYWVVVHKFFSNAFYSFLITDSGINEPIISNTGSQHGNILDPSSIFTSIGQMKISPDGSLLALCFSNTSPSVMEVFSFDKETGLVTNCLSLPSSSGEEGVYGVEFSPDSKKLYFSCNSFGRIIQYDLSSGIDNPTEVINSQIEIFNNGIASQHTFGLQLGPDNRIYAVRMDATYLGVISSPNNYGTDCNYSPIGMDLCGRTGSFGLPGFIANYDYSNNSNPCSSYNEEKLINETLFYPNPAKSNIVFSENVDYYEITNFVAQKILSGKKKNINITNYPKGCYQIRMLIGKETIIKKLIIL